ncbi:MAG: phosphotransferase [Pleurocapsa sp.]
MIKTNCLVKDRFNITQDEKMPFLKDALDRIKVGNIFKNRFDWFGDNYQLVKIEVIRYKPQKRCLIEYHFEGEQSLVLIGKVRAKGLDTKSYELQKELWQSGFNDNSDDGISVPEPVGIIPEWQMWLQKKVPGELVINYLTTNKGVAVSKKVAQVAHKLHQVNILPQRSHTMADELAILEDKLPLVLIDYPQWESRIKTILAKCHILGESIPEDPACGIHRDFYFDQIIVDRDRFYLLDLDLYCQGNPNLDIGNFIAHITEYRLRTFGNVNALREQETALEEEFLNLTKQPDNNAIQAYKILTLVRHIYLSNIFPERRFITEVLLNLCEEGLKHIMVIQHL